MTKMSTDIFWLNWHPTHYNEYLFQEIDKSEEFSLSVFYLKSMLNSHPWENKQRYNYSRSVFTRSYALKRSYYRHVFFSKGLFVIAGWNNINFLLSILILSFLSKPYVVWSDTPNVMKKRKGASKFIRKALLQFIFKYSKGILATGNIGVENFKQMGAPEHKINCFPFATDVNYFSPKQRVTQIDKIVFLMSGRLDIASKCQDLAIKSVAELMKENIEVHLHIAGVGVDEDRLRLLVKELNLENQVEFMGWLQFDDLQKFYQSGDYFIHPSVFDPYPNAVLEAMATGLPVIGSNLAGSAKDRVIDGINGYIFESGSLEDLVLKMKSILIYGTKNQMSNNARKTATKNSVQENINTLKKICDEIN
jgi:glycosyltransferase involved in cell wall biosynthesis